MPMPIAKKRKTLTAPELRRRLDGECGITASKKTAELDATSRRRLNAQVFLSLGGPHSVLRSVCPL